MKAFTFFKAAVPVLLIAASIAVPGVRAAAPDAAKVEAMRALEFLAGEWEGEGWIARGPGPRSTFQGREIVELRLGGTVMLIEGIHRSLLPGSAEPSIVHHALAVVSPAADGGYHFRSWLSSGDGGDFRGRVEDGAFIWGMNTPRGEIRYTIRLDEAGRWHEIGEFLGEDGEWRQFFEMTLKKVG